MPLTQVEAYGKDRMKTDLKKLHDISEAVEKKCIMEKSDREHMNKGSMYRPFSQDVIAFKVKWVSSYLHLSCVFNHSSNFSEDIHECRLLGMPENSLFELAKTKQFNRWNEKETEH